jgi:hypothetical protein
LKPCTRSSVLLQAEGSIGNCLVEEFRLGLVGESNVGITCVALLGDSQEILTGRNAVPGFFCFIDGGK